jgi:zinc protease
MMIATKKIAISLATALATGLFCHISAWAAIPIQHWTQASGARVYLVESPAVAMLDVQIDFDAGSRRDPPAQTGLASIMADMLDKGVQARNGAPALDENALSEAWADLGAHFGAGASADRLSFSLRSLTEPDLLDKAVALAARELAEPSFPESVWQRERQRMQAALKESYTRPASVVGRAYGRGG